MAKDYGLKLTAHPLQAQGYIELGDARDWARSTTFTGGPWQGTFKVFGEKDFLEQWFYEYLGFHLEESSFGSTTWEGFTWEIDFVDFDKSHWTRFTKRGRRRRRTYETMFNKVMCAFNDPETSSQGETSWYNDTNSQARYGIKEEIIYRDLQQAAAEEAAQEFLAMHAHPNPQLISLEENVDEPFLEVSVVGYVATAQFRFTSTVDDSSSNVGDWVDDVFSTDLQFLSKFRRATNSRSIKQSLGERMRAWDLLENLLTLRDGSGNQFNIIVEPGRLISYDQWDPDPIGYFWNGALTTPNFDNMEERPRMIRPGIYRASGFISDRSIVAMQDSFFQSPQDFLLEMVEIDAKGEVIPRLGVYTDEEALRTFKFD